MKKQNDKYIFSPSDLVVFMESPFASWMNRFNLDFPGVIAKDADDAATKLLQTKGIEHERNYLQTIISEGKTCHTIDTGTISGAQAVKETIEAMQSGYDVIYQGALSSSDSSFAGFADFLVKVPGASKLGDYYYEPWDTKLANKPKPYFIIQLCCYAELLEEIQGTYPEHIKVVLGSGKIASFATNHFKYFYRQLKQSFLDQQTNFNVLEKPMPTGFEEYRGWSSHAKELLEERDHLCRIANISQHQIKCLSDSGITTLTQLATQNLPPVKKLSAEILANLQRQAKLQYESATLDTPKYELRRGTKNSQVNSQVNYHVDSQINFQVNALSQLPPASHLDVFFDMEGYPHVKGGLEYLFGAVTEKGFHDWWAHDAQEEKQAFEQFIDWIMDRYKQDLLMHIYHYGAYEISALRRLMGRCGTREDQVDELLRNGVFIDLYKLVRQSLVIGEPNYSIKSVEHLYRPKRQNEVATALDSVVFYNQWLENKDGNDWASSPTLNAIRDYNKVDCESTRDLTHWLRRVQADHKISWLFQSNSTITISQEEEDEEESKQINPAQELSQTLLARAQELTNKNQDDKAALCRLFAYLLEFHRRADKPMWWAMFDRHTMEEQELIDDLDCLGGLVLRADRKPTETGRGKVKSSILVQYQFEPGQDTKLTSGSNCFFAHDLKIRAQIVALDLEAGLVTLKFKKNIEPPHSLNLIPDEHISSATLAQAVYDIVKEWNESGQLPGGIHNFLTKQKPQFDPPLETSNIINDTKDIVEEVKDKVAKLHQSTICIQGPPGSGKTFTAAHTIVDLLGRGKRIAISSNTHKAVINLMARVVEIALEKNVKVQAIKIGGDKEESIFSFDNVRHADGIDDPSANLVGGTAWAFAKPSCKNYFDYLFVDEAGQVSIANLLAMSRCSKNIALLGDQMQLAQPVKGSHPEESGLSTLEYLLGEHQTIPPELGIFLGITHRLHPQICSFISESFYDNRLLPHPDNAKRTLAFNPPSGILFVPVNHEGNTQSSDEEVIAIAKLIEELKHRGSISKEDCANKPLNIEKDVLIVAPYNMQVQKLKQALPNLRIGTVDKFQGQEASVVIISMCASNAAISLRGLEFLLSKPRLNVAISRAQTLAIIVGNPNLAKANCTTIEQMELVNNFCKIMHTRLKKDLPERVFL